MNDRATSNSGVSINESTKAVDQALLDQFTCPADPELQRLMHADMQQHLKSPAGRLSNYHGKYSKSHIYAGMEDYPEVFRKDDYDRILDDKRHRFAMKLVSIGETVLDIVAQEPEKKCQNLEMIKMAKDIVMGDDLVKEQTLVKAESRGCVEFPISWDD